MRAAFLAGSAFLLAAAATVLLAGSAAAADASVTITGCGNAAVFQPTSFEVEVGDTVTWTNADSCTAHTATSGNDWDTGVFYPGESRSVTFDEVGEGSYVCTLHQNMVGTWKVVPSTNVAPTVAVAEPADGATVARGSVTIRGTASADAVDVTLVIDGGAPRDVAGVASWSYAWDTSGLVPGSTHTIRARAVDDGGLTAESALVTVTIENLAPQVTFTAPTEGATVSGDFVVAGTAADDLAVDKVEVRVDGGPWRLATGTTAWSWTWATGAESNGAHTLEARAVDGAGRETVAGPIEVTVENVVGDDDAPVVTFDAPADGATLQGVVALAGNASDDLGVVAVEWRVDDGAWRAADGLGPWTASLDTAAFADGAHRVTVRARDGTGHNATATRNFTFSNPAAARVALTINLTEGARLVGAVNLTGEARGALVVEVRVDEGPWIAARLHPGGWSYTLDTSKLLDGAHTLTVRAPAPPSGYVTRGPVAFTTANGRTATEDGAATEGGGVRPVVSPVSPAPDERVAGAVRFRVEAYDADGPVPRIRLLVDNRVLAEGRSPLEYTWPAFDAVVGEHEARAEACDAGGCGSAVWRFTVVPKPPAEADDGTHEDAVDATDDTVPGGLVGSATDRETPAAGAAFLAGALAAAAAARSRRRG